MRRWEDAYRLPPARQLAELGAMHHRLVWIHPFIDGNGRASRLLSHAVLRRNGVGSPLRAIARGLARNVERYRALLQAADQRGRSDPDGREALSERALSERALVDFNRFFDEQALDRVAFMGGLIEPDRLLTRILQHVREEVDLGHLDRGAETVVRAVFRSGEIARGGIDDLLDSSPRTRSRRPKSLFEMKMLQSESH